MIGRQLRRARTILRQLNAVRSESGAYRYFIRHWDDVTDLNILAQALATDYFRTELSPVAATLGERRRIVLLAPHQDDEALGAGGALALARDAGCEIHIVYVTDGAARQPPFARDSAAGVRVRFEEAERVCRRLSATLHRLDISNVSPQPTIKHLNALKGLLTDVQPHVVLTPWIFDLPCKHRLVNHVLATVGSGIGLDAEVWSYQTHTPIVANVFVDITRVIAEKRSLLEEFHSQNDHTQNYAHLAEGLAAWNSRLMPQSPESRYAEVFFTVPVAEFVRLVRRYYSMDLARTYRGEPRVAEAMSRVPWTLK